MWVLEIIIILLLLLLFRREHMRIGRQRPMIRQRPGLLQQRDDAWDYTYNPGQGFFLMSS